MDIKNIVANNLIKLRKHSKMTQYEIAELLKYSDKAVSRWESGEVTPDLDVLNKIAEIYNIPFASLFDENLEADAPQKIEKEEKKEKGNRAAIILLSISFVWILATIIYVYANIILGQAAWQIFIYAIPVTFLVAIIFGFFWGPRFWWFFYMSVFVWTLLTAIYVSFINYNVWMIFLLGAPIQISIILWSTIHKKKK